jgi:hypothetical protein
MTLPDTLSKATFAALLECIRSNIPCNDSEIWNVRREGGGALLEECIRGGIIAPSKENMKAYDRVMGRYLAHSFADQADTISADHLAILRSADVAILKDKNGSTVAHSLAFYGELPSNFTNFMIADKNGTTIAHICQSIEDLINVRFDSWDVEDGNGECVAYLQAEKGEFDPNWSSEIWGLNANKGRSVLEALIMELQGIPPELKIDTEDSLGVSAGQYAIKHGVWVYSEGWQVNKKVSFIGGMVEYAKKYSHDIYNKMIIGMELESDEIQGIARML